MRDLASRQASRIARKAEDAIAGGMPFDMSRSGIGVCHPTHADAAKVNEQADAAILRVANAIGAAPVSAGASGFATPYQHKVKLSGV